MTTRIVRKIEFDAGHRVLRHEGKCAHLHGHRYSALIEIEAPSLDSIGRVIDFGVVKQIIGRWVDEEWDHNLLLHPDDPLFGAIEELNELKPIKFRPDEADWNAVIFGPYKQPYVMQYADPNPTAENMAHELFKVSSNLLCSYSIEVESVTIYETPNCSATYTKDRY